MIRLLARIFIRDAENTADPRVRRAYGALCSVTAICLNILLFAAKNAVGRMAGSVSIQADAVNNLTDAGSAVLILLAFRFAGKKPTPELPFGHGRIEYIAGMIVAGVVLVLGVEFGRESVEKLLHPRAMDVSRLGASVLVLALSIGLKFCMAGFCNSVGKRIDSSALRAAGADNLSDTAATFAALVSLLVYALTPKHLNLDGWFGLLVSLLIVKAGVSAGWETLRQLLGQKPDPAVVDGVSAVCGRYPEILGMHDLVIHDYGPGRLMVSLHAEVSGSGDVFALHDAMDRAMDELDKTLGCESVIHMDPISTDRELVGAMRAELSEAVKALGSGVSIHDFRVVTGPTHTNVVFDCVVPWDTKLTETEARDRVKAIVASLWDNTFAVVKIDRPYV